MKLTPKEKEVRNFLIRVAKGEVQTLFPRLITYKELWGEISDEVWGQGQQRKIVGFITKISAYDIEHGRPPLNEIVVLKKTKEPSEEWDSIRNYIKSRSGKYPPFKTHKEAQAACWTYWSSSKNKESSESEVEEGLAGDKTVKFRKRNKRLVIERKKKDNNTCQCCGFRLKIQDKYIIDVHHKYPLSGSDDVRVTSLDDLVCLCPNCHRVSHTRSFPLSEIEVKELITKASSRRAKGARG